MTYLVVIVGSLIVLALYVGALHQLRVGLEREHADDKQVTPDVSSQLRVMPTPPLKPPLDPIIAAYLDVDRR